MVTVEDVYQLYGSKKVMFTLKMFESITKNEKALKNYRKGLKAIRGRLIA
jgi:hypothetical protein